jgi:hypothetical protein
MARKATVQIEKKPEYIVYADFELDGVEYRDGDAFVPPAHYAVDQNLMDIRKQTQPGTAFIYSFKTTHKNEAGVAQTDSRSVFLPVQ